MALQIAASKKINKLTVSMYLKLVIMKEYASVENK